VGGLCGVRPRARWREVDRLRRITAKKCTRQKKEVVPRLQCRVDLGREVYVQCRVFEWYHAYGRWLDRYRERKRDGLTDSHAIRLRDKRQLQPTAPAYPPPPHLRVTYLKKAMLQAANLQEPAVAEVGQGGEKRRSDGLQGIPMLDSQSSGSGHRP